MLLRLRGRVAKSPPVSLSVSVVDMLGPEDPVKARGACLAMQELRFTLLPPSPSPPPLVSVCNRSEREKGGERERKGRGEGRGKMEGCLLQHAGAQ
eukprot:1841405-Rhodomonas_salina.1